MGQRTYTKLQLVEAAQSSNCKRQVLEKLGLSSNGSGGYRSLNVAIVEWNIDVSHFDPYKVSRENRTSPHKPLNDWLVLSETQSPKSSSLKQRLYQESLKTPICELCGQGEKWRGSKMSLILDHINGNHLDNRIENLQIVCPNCNATLDTHCGKQLRIKRFCLACNTEIIGHGKYCSKKCRARFSNSFTNQKKPRPRKVERPSYDILCQEIRQTGYVKVGQKYGVSDNAIRKWVIDYQKASGIKEDIKFQYGK